MGAQTAVHCLTQALALENCNGITCNALVPGIIDTPANINNILGADNRGWVALGVWYKIFKKLRLSKENSLLLEI